MVLYKVSSLIRIKVFGLTCDTNDDDTDETVETLETPPAPATGEGNTSELKAADNIEIFIYLAWHIISEIID